MVALLLHDKFINYDYKFIILNAENNVFNHAFFFGKIYDKIYDKIFGKIFAFLCADRLVGMRFPLVCFLTSRIMYLLHGLLQSLHQFHPAIPECLHECFPILYR